MILRFESHIHTNYSDGNFYKLMIWTAINKKIDVLAVTDHNTLKGYKHCVTYAKEYAARKKREIFMLPAEEVGCSEGDVLAYGITEEVKRGSVAEVVDIIHNQGGVAVIAHPFSPLTSFAGKDLQENHFDGIEVNNYNSFDLINRLAQRFARKRPYLFQMGGNDAHQPWDVGIVLNLIEAEPETDSILQALKKKRIRIVESPKVFPWRAKFYLKCNITNALTTIRTGMRYQMRYLYKKVTIKKSYSLGSVFLKKLKNPILKKF